MRSTAVCSVLALCWGCGVQSSPPASTGGAGGSGMDGVGGSVASGGQGTGGVVASELGLLEPDDLPTASCGSVGSPWAYGPIGEPVPLPLPTVSSTECLGCAPVIDVFGSRTPAGYSFLWTARSSSDGPGDLRRVATDPSFAGSAAPGLLVEGGPVVLRVVPGPSGFLATTCSSESEAAWFPLSEELELASGQSLVPPSVPCGYRPPNALWTGEGYLTSYGDERGLVVAALDAQGAVVGEVMVSPEGTDGALVRSGDRVLCVLRLSDRAHYAVLDLSGGLLTPLEPIGEPETDPNEIAVVATQSGWLVATDVNGGGGIQLTGISVQGAVLREQRLGGPGYAWFHAFRPSASGGFLLAGGMYTGGQFGADHRLVALFDDEGEVVFAETTQVDPGDSLPLGVIEDPVRDLVIQEADVEEPGGTGTVQTLTVQEYGCLE